MGLSSFLDNLGGHVDRFLGRERLPSLNPNLNRSAEMNRLIADWHFKQRYLSIVERLERPQDVIADIEASIDVTQRLAQHRILEATTEPSDFRAVEEHLRSASIHPSNRVLPRTSV